jgi:hypothetical protein
MIAAAAARLPGRPGSGQVRSRDFDELCCHAPGTATSPTTPTLTIKHQPRPVSAMFRPTRPAFCS